MKLSDIFKKKSNSTKTEKSVIKIDKKQLEKIVGGAGGKTTPITIKMGGSGI